MDRNIFDDTETITLTVKKAETNDDKIPFVPMLPVMNEPSFC